MRCNNFSKNSCLFNLFSFRSRNPYGVSSKAVYFAFKFIFHFIINIHIYIQFLKMVIVKKKAAMLDNY